MAKPEKSKQGCFSGFIRVLLCAGNGTSPPVHPSDETEFVHYSKKDSIFEDNAAITTTPGLVARLMGLESLPKTNFVVKGATLDSVPRSRSVNFVDYMVNFGVAGKSNNHRRAMTSASFREVPVPALANMGQENENDLVVFCWDGDVCKEHEAGFEKKLKELEIGLEELKQGKKQGNKNKNKEIISVKKERNNNNNNNNNNSQGKSKKISKLKNEPRRVPSTNHGKKRVRIQSEEKGFSSVSSSSKSSSSCYSSKLQNNNKQKKEFVEESSHTRKMRKQKLSKKMMESDCNSENQVTLFLDGISPIASKSKWKSSPLISISDNVENSSINNKGFDCAYTDIINKEAEYYSELLKLQTLTEHDIREFDYCTTKHVYEYEEFEEICFSLEHKILDLLLHEVVNEVVELCC